MPQLWLVSDSQPANRRDVLGLFNWESQDQTIVALPPRQALTTGRTTSHLISGPTRQLRRSPENSITMFRRNPAVFSPCERPRAILYS
jgi:hypothetical protein